MSREKFDVCVVGGGLVGLCSAYQLAKRKYKVVIAEKADNLATEASSNNGAVTWPFMQMLSEPFLYRFVKDGIEAHKRLSASGLRYDYRTTGAIHVFYSHEEMKGMVKQLEALPSTERYQPLESNELHELEPAYSRSIIGGVLYPECAQGLAHKLDSELTKAITAMDVSIKTVTEVKGFRKDSKRIQSAATSNGEILADYFTIAAGPWCNRFSDDLGFGIPTIPIKGHLISWRPPENVTSHLMVTRRGAVLPTPDGLVRSGGGMDYVGYDRGPNERVVRILTNTAVEAIPSLVDLPGEVWTGFRPGTPDALPILGYADAYENLLIAAGHYHEGFSTCAITGEVIADLISKGRSELPYLGWYRPGRFNC